MSRVELEKLADDLGVMRVAKHVAPLFKPPDYRNPTWRAFKLTGEDVAEGTKRGRDPGLSVFDTERATPENAVDIRDFFERRYRQRPLGPASVYATNAVRVREATQRADIAAFHDPLPDPEDETRQWAREGARGHAVIEGLYESDPDKQESADYKAMLAKVAKATDRIFESP